MIKKELNKLINRKLFVRVHLKKAKKRNPLLGQRNSNETTGPVDGEIPDEPAAT